MQLVELNKSTYQYGFIDIKSEEKRQNILFQKNSDFSFAARKSSG